MYNTRSCAKRRSLNAGKIPHSFNKPTELKKQNKVKKGSRLLGAFNYNKPFQKSARKGNIGCNLTSQKSPVSSSFFTRGFKSLVARKNKAAGQTNEFNEKYDKILNENLEGLLQSAENLNDINFEEIYDPTRPQLSAHFVNLFNKNQDNNKEGEILRDCFSKILSVAEEHQETENCNESVFKEINYKYDELRLENNTQSDPEESFAEEAELYSRNNTVNADFCRLLQSQLVGFEGDSAVSRTISKIQLILDSLQSNNEEETSKMTELNKQLVNKCNCDEASEDNANLQLVPPSSWVFRTPNDQKLKQLPADEPILDLLKPAILQTSDETKVLYEIDENVVKHVNLENYVGQKRMVPINPYMTKQVCEVNLSTDDHEDEKFVSCKNKDSWQDIIKNYHDDTLSFKMPLSKPHGVHRAVFRDTTNLVREVTDPNKRHSAGFPRFVTDNVASSSGASNKVSPYSSSNKKENSRPFYTQRPIKTIKKSCRSFKKPPKKLTFDFESKRQKLSLFDNDKSPDVYNLDESQEAFNESFTFIKTDAGAAMDIDCSLTENYYGNNATVTASPLDVEMDTAGANYATGGGANLYASEVSYNLNEHFLNNYSKITETPTFKLYPRQNYDAE
ncbi:uncharacterized protein LOC108739315 [Agrilus planipennis]|uniref:Uncharacterized protein LOC108739315 n=1 Tax=Agrilus planipennis TaxID=224129 RepID=A0A1W4WXQ6_AGRPL|nr:uncharacterized protein LOC108739315 [Agrilus planipennis]